MPTHLVNGKYGKEKFLFKRKFFKSDEASTYLEGSSRQQSRTYRPTNATRPERTSNFFDNFISRLTGRGGAPDSQYEVMMPEADFSPQFEQNPPDTSVAASTDPIFMVKKVTVRHDNL